MKWLAWLWPWHRRNGHRDEQARQALAEQQRKLRDTERTGDEVSKVVRALERQMTDPGFLADVEAALASRRHR